ncbi:hypothetical protein SAMN05660874_04137 [Saccharopolyspora flava]|uniref:Uncharacterized protein n=1 Tax=Saccharopolyspora flava TaxID=95161 RepID=A0A1I6TNU1_9PSEU|nr:hypothetical protein SAMN05660874_04137 [Saccharopolyspora flava]
MGVSNCAGGKRIPASSCARVLQVVHVGENQASALRFATGDSPQSALKVFPSLGVTSVVAWRAPVLGHQVNGCGR